MKKIYRLAILFVLSLLMGISAGNIFLDDFMVKYWTTIKYSVGLMPVLYVVYTVGRYMEWNDRQNRNK